MPDWFYRTVSRPVLFRLPAVTARNFALGFMGRLARLPLGPAMIDFMGHMRADARLRRTLLGIDFPSAVGLGPGLDGAAVALPALARFGFGFLEVGPVTVAASAAARPIERRPNQEAIWLPDPPESLSLSIALPRITEAARLGLPLIARIGATSGAGAERAAEECRQLVAELGPQVRLIALATLGPALAEGWSEAQWAAHVRAVIDTAHAAATPRPLLLCVPADVEPGRATPLLDVVPAVGAAGFLIDGSVRAHPDGRLIGLPARAPALALVRHLRHAHGDRIAVIASGGVHEQDDALALRAAGADLVEVDSGLVYTGPGLPKRINEAMLFATTRRAEPPAPERAPEMTWFWTSLLGAGMLVGSLLTLAVAATRVVLPYDEHFVGMSRAELYAVNPRLLAFMAHDRVSLAGTMIAVGIMYLGLSLFGVRRGLHWARQAVYVSAFTGFASFFLFLGFGYLDTLHAFVTAALLQLLLLGVHSRLGSDTSRTAGPLRSGRAWRLSLWGQLLLVVHGSALLAAGATISFVGVTQVFVPEDLHFMQTTAEVLRAANPRLVPLIAHDRATFGGMLLASGWAFLLPALWGFRNGSAWLWWTLLAAGLSAYAAAIGVHYAVGYTDVMHLLPAFGGLVLFLVGLGLSCSYLCGREAADAARQVQAQNPDL